MSLALDDSSPGIVSGAGPTLTTDSFTPPTDSTLLVGWAGDANIGEDPAQPTITDSLGSPLPYELIDHITHADSAHANGQAAMWWVRVPTSAAMTLSVTNQSSASHGALRVQVWTGAAPASASATPIGAHGSASATTSTSAITQSYTAQASGGQGVIAVCEWDNVGAETAGTGCTLDGSASEANISYAFAHRTVDDDVAGATNSLNVQLPTNSQNISWIWAEMLPLGYINPDVADPPPFVVSYRPGQMSPNGRLAPWRGGGALPVSPAVDASTPVAAFATTNPLTTDSFTPPAGSTLVIGWAGDGNGGETVAQPTITDSLGVHLTYNLIAFRNRSDAPNIDGQAAMWWANVPVTPATPMTVTVTSQSTAAAGAVKVWVYTNADLVAPIGTFGKAGSASSASFAQPYAPTSDGGQQLLVVCDVANAQTSLITAPAGCTLDDTSLASSANIDWAFIHRTKADNAIGRTMTIGVNLPNTSTDLIWIWAEVKAGTPAQVAVAAATPQFVSQYGSYF